MKISDEDLLPASTSKYAWRWTDERHDLLSADIRQSIYVIRSARAKQIHEQLLEQEKAVRQAPERKINTENTLREDVQAWLAELPSVEGDRAVISWSQEDAIVLPWSIFSKYWDAFCYPSSDDAVIVLTDERWILVYTHWGEYFWKSLNRSGLTTG